MKPSEATRSAKRSIQVHPVHQQLSAGEFRKALPQLTRVLPRLADIHHIPLRLPITETIRRLAQHDVERGHASTFDMAIALMAQVTADRWAAAGRPAWAIHPLPTGKRFHCTIHMCVDAWLYVCEFAWHAGCDLATAVAHLAQIETRRSL